MVEEPEPGAAMDVGLKLAVAPVGSPDAESETAELKVPETEVEMVEVPVLPCAMETDDGDDEIEKSEVCEGLKMMSMTGCSSMPFGATPVCPWRKSNMPTPVTWTGMLAVWKLVVAVNMASNCERACEMPEAKGLPAPTQLGAGISVIMVLPDASCKTMW
jgi:hypothetical protein